MAKAPNTTKQNTKAATDKANKETSNTQTIAQQEAAKEVNAKPAPAAESTETKTAKPVQVSINGGEAIDASTPEGMETLTEFMTKAQEGLAQGEKVKVSINGGPEFDHDDPKLSVEMDRLLEEFEEGGDKETEFKAHDEETDAANAKGAKKDNAPKPAELKAAMDSTTVTNAETGVTTRQFSPENPNETFTENNAKKAETKSAAAQAETEDENADAGDALVKAVDELLSFGQPLAGALSGKPNVMRSWQEAVAKAQKALAGFQASKA